MKSFVLVSLCFFVLCCRLANAQTQENGFEAVFKSGTEQYQAKKYDEARLSFLEAIKLDPSHSSALTNLALVEYQLNNRGNAVAYLRRALHFDSQFSTPQSALDFILPQLEVKEIPHEILFTESLRTQILVPHSLNSFLFLTALSLFSAGWFFLSYVGRRRQAVRSQNSLPAWPLIPAIMGLFFVSFLTLSFLKMRDLVIPRGTIINSKIAVKSAPDNGAAVLYEIDPGLEVIIQTVQGEWSQVTYPGGMTGWIPKTHVLQTSGKDLL